MWKNIPFQPCVLVCTWYRVSVPENGMWYSQNDKSKAVGKASAILWSGISSPEICKAWRMFGPKLRGKKLIISVQIFMGCDNSKIYKWGRIFFVRVDIRKSNFHGQPENLGVKGKTWNMLDYPCASKFTLYVKATHNRNTINERRKKKVHFCPTHPPL